MTRTAPEPQIDPPADSEGTPEEPSEAAPTAPEVELLRAKLAALDERLCGTLAQYKEARDDFESSKARLKRDLTKEIDAGKHAILSGLLEVVDNLERALEAAAKDHSPKDSFLQGVGMVHQQFLQKLAQFGARKVELLNTPFNPSLSEAVSTVPVSDPAQVNRVVAVLRASYVTDSATLRPGLVVVGAALAPPQKNQETKTS
jgi:molecular chaperone GrpE